MRAHHIGSSTLVEALLLALESGSTAGASAATGGTPAATTTVTATASTTTTAAATAVREAAPASATSSTAAAVKATTSSAATAPSATAASALALRGRVVDPALAPLDLLAVERAESGRRVREVLKLDVGKALGVAGVEVGREPDVGDLAVLAKVLVERVLGRREGQVANPERRRRLADLVAERLGARVGLLAPRGRVVDLDLTALDLERLLSGVVEDLDGLGLVLKLDVADATRAASLTVCSRGRRGSGQFDATRRVLTGDDKTTHP